MNRAAILLYHIVDEPQVPAERRYCCLPQRFRQQMRYLAERGFSPLSLQDLVDGVRGLRPLPENAVAVTFDDGFECLHRNALPALAEYGIPATVFLVAGLIGKSNAWMEANGLPSRRLLTSTQVAELAACKVTIGCHSYDHPHLTAQTPEQLEIQLLRSKRVVSDAIGMNADHFAYPFGDYDKAVRDAVEAAGYRSACTTRAGFNPAGHDPFQLRRIEVFADDNQWRFAQKLKFGVNTVGTRQYLRYYAGRVAARLSL